MRSFELANQNRAYLGRVISAVAQRYGIPVQVIAHNHDNGAAGKKQQIFQFFESIPGTLEDAFRYLGTNVECAQELSDLYKSNREFLIFSGRQYEHPFVTLLREQPLWYWWELSNYFRASCEVDSESDAGLVTRLLLNGSLAFGIQHTSLLDGRILIGPVPVLSEGWDRGVLRSELMRVRHLIGEVSEFWSTKETRPAALEPRNFSIDRLTRMYHIGGRETQRSFDLKARRIAGSLDLALAAAISEDISDCCKIKEIIRISDTAARLGLFFEELSFYGTTFIKNRKNMSFFQFPTKKRTFEIEFLDLATTARVNKIKVLSDFISKGGKIDDRKEVEKFGVEINFSTKSAIPEEIPQAQIIADGKIDDRLTDLFQWIMQESGAQFTKEKLLQFALGRNWLNDRFARLGPLVSTGELDNRSNSNRICQWLLRVFDVDFVALYQGRSGEGPTGNTERPFETQGALIERGKASRSNRRAEYWRDRNSEQMEALAELLDDWPSSICYRAFMLRETQSVYEWDGTRSKEGMYDRDLPEEEDGAQDSNQSQERSPRVAADFPRSAIASPIMVFGRPWGVIELVSFTPSQFEASADYWLEETCRLIGSPLFHTWLFGQLNQLNLAALAGVDTQHVRARENPEQDEVEAQQRAPVSPTEQGSPVPDYLLEAEEKLNLSQDAQYLQLMNKVCEHMARIFLADGAGLWLETEQWPGSFELRGYHGVHYRDLLRGGSETQNGLNGGTERDWRPPHFVVSEPDSLVVRAIQLERDRSRPGAGRIIVQDRIAEPVDPDGKAGRSSREEYQAAIWKSGIRHMAIVPLFEPVLHGEDRPIGALALYSRDSNGTRSSGGENADGYAYDERWIPYMDFAGRHVAMLIRTIESDLNRKNDLELMFSHDVFSALNRINDQFGYLQKNFFEPVAKTIRHKRPIEGISPRQIDHLEKVVARVSSVSEQALARSEEMRREGFRLPGQLSFKSTRPWDRHPYTLFNEIQAAFNSRYLLIRTRNLNWKVTGTNEYIRINKFHPDDLRTILENLVDNALKYSIFGGSVIVDTSRKDKMLYLSIRNHGAPLRHGEKSRIFKRAFRGQAARNSDQVGTGNGLFIARRLCGEIGADLSYDSRPTNDPKIVSHILTITISDRDVIYGRGGE